jgi:hypothetical protein
MSTDHLASAALYFAAGIPIAFVIGGGITTTELGKALITSQRSLGGVFRAGCSRDRQLKNALLVVIANLAAMTAVLWLEIVLFARSGPTRATTVGLVIMTAVQGGLALMAHLRSYDIVSHQRSDLNDPNPGARQHSRGNRSGRGVDASELKEKHMPRPSDPEVELTRKERAEFIQRGMKHYEALRSKLEQEHRGEYIAISVKTGRYTTTRDDAKLKVFADSLSPDDFLWMTRVGSA